MTTPAANPRSPVPAWQIGLAVFVYLACWAVIRPPLQSPDEPQHLMKANSVRLQPWLNAVPDRFLPDRRTLNPLAWETPNPLDKLFFQPMNALTVAEVDALRRTPWLPRDGPALPSYQRAIASYPQVYYWSVFALAEPIIQAGGLAPYDASFVYRLATCALVAVVWALVWIACRRAGLPEPVAGLLLAVTVLNPMLAFISSAVNPDAVNDACCALAIVAAWEVLARGTGAIRFGGAMLAALMTKPAGLQLAVVLVVVVAGLAVIRRVERRRAGMVAGATIAATGLSAVLFYAWQPLRFLGSGPSADTLATYLARRWESIAWIWRSYWGQLGWLDYHAPVWWYWLLLALLLVNLACLAWRRQRPAALAWYLGALWLVFTVSAIGAEFRYLAQAGYTFQGRYLLPASIGLGAVLLHEVRAARIALVAAIVALNVVLLRETVHRYYAGGWKTAAQALPFR